MAPKTLIRNDRPHEVKLGQGDQVAQSHKADAQGMEIPPALIRKTSSRAAAQTPPPEAPASAPRKARSDTGAAPRRKRAAAAPEAPAAAKPKLPARVPADRLWEEDSIVAQRLNALLQHNARLAEQLQRLQSPVRSKGIAP